MQGMGRDQILYCQYHDI